MVRLLAIAAIAVAAACGSSTNYGNPPPPPPPPPPAPPPPPPPPAPTLSVSVANNSFTPSNGPLLSGGTVTWNWSGTTASHNITFEDGQGNSGNQTTGSHVRTFPTVTASTTFRYRCTNHSTAFGSGMSGQVVVTP
jgi:plastocyanin